MYSEAHPDRGDITFPTAPGTDRLPPDTDIRRRFFERRTRAYRDEARERLLDRYDRDRRAVRLRHPNELAAREKRSALFRLALSGQPAKAKRVALLAAAERANSNLERYGDRLKGGEREAFERLYPMVCRGVPIRQAAERAAEEGPPSAGTLRIRYHAAMRKLA